MGIGFVWVLCVFYVGGSKLHIGLYMCLHVLYMFVGCIWRFTMFYISCLKVSYEVLYENYVDVYWFYIGYCETHTLVQNI